VTLRLEDKKAIVAEVAEVAANAISAIAVDYRGLTVTEMNELRLKARNSGVYLRVVRNTLARRAVAESSFVCMQPVLTGPMLLAFSSEDPGAAARLFKEFVKTHTKCSVKALAIGGQLLDSNQLDVLASLPTRDEAIAQLMAVMIAPVTQFVRTLAEPCAKFVRTLAAVADQKNAG
jgi:large subunit ribosomal protein L10